MARRHIGGTSPPPPPCTLEVGQTKELPFQLENVEPLGCLLISSLLSCFFSLGQVEVWTTAEYRCVRLGSRSATEARWCSPTAAARWKDVPEERMWQQEVLILPAPACSMPLPARNLAGNPLRPQRKSTESQPRKSCVCPQEIHTKSV